MELTALKEIIVNGREIVTKLAEALSNIMPFESNKIAGFLVLILSFWVSNSLLSIFPNLKANLLIKILATAALFYALWLW